MHDCESYGFFIVVLDLLVCLIQSRLRMAHNAMVTCKKIMRRPMIVCLCLVDEEMKT